MLIKVHSTLKEAKPRRALFMTLGLFIVTIGLAFSLIRERQENKLGPSISLNPLPISFNPPRGFKPLAPSNSEIGAFLVGQSRQRHLAALAVWKLAENVTGSHSDLASQVMYWQNFLWKVGSPKAQLTELHGKIGNIDGVELAGLKDGFVARIAELRKGETYVVSLSVREGPIDPKLYELFDLSCRTVILDSSGS